MDKRLDKLLCESFPALYSQRSLPKEKTAMYWGFDCGDGWFSLIWALSEELARTSPHTEATQVKEKFGGLRFYVDGASPEGHDAIEYFEQASLMVCESCGGCGRRRQNKTGWITTRCERHQ